MLIYTFKDTEKLLRNYVPIVTKLVYTFLGDSSVMEIGLIFLANAWLFSELINVYVFSVSILLV